MLGPALLAYNLAGRDAVALKELCRGHGLLWKEIAPSEYALPLGALVGLPAAPVERAPAAPAAPFREPMLVMANLTRPQFDGLLGDMRSQGVRVPLKAVLTPVNVGWDSVRLHDELLREHEAMARRRPDT